MAKENEDLNTGQPVTDPDLNAQPVTEPGVSDSAGVQQEPAVLADGTSQDKDVPYTQFKAANEAKKAAEEAQQLAEQQLQQTRDQMALVQAQPRVEPQKTVSPYEQSLIDCGLNEEEILSREQQIQVNARKDQIDAGQRQQNQQVIANQQFAQSHPDFGKAVGQVNPLTGQFMASAELQEILIKKPYLSASCLTAQGAYNIIMQERNLAELSKKATAMEEHQGQQNADNRTTPMSPSSVAGGGVSRKKDQITESSTAEDVRALEQRVKRGEFD